MKYYVMFHRISPLTRKVEVAEDTIEATDFSVGSEGSLVLYNDSVATRAFPAGSWFGIEPVSEDEETR